MTTDPTLDVKIPACLLPWVAALRDKRFSLFHRPRGRKKWTLIGVFKDLETAWAEQDARIARGETGGWRLEKVTKFPCDEGEEE